MPQALPARFPATAPTRFISNTRDVPKVEACDLQARMFHPGASGLTEDPATGSATVATAALLADLDATRDGELKLRIGRASTWGGRACC